MMMAAVFSVLGLHSPYFPLWLSARGLGESDIALVMGVPLVLRLVVAGPVGRLADGRTDRRPLVAGLLLATLAAGLMLLTVHDFVPIFLFSVVMMMAFQPAPTIVDATLGSLARRGVVRSVGRVRIWGSISFALVAAAGGPLLAIGGVDSVFAASLALLVITLCVSILLPSGGERESTARVERLKFRDYPELTVVMIAIALINGSQALYFSFGSVHMQAIGFPAWSLGMIWTVAVVAEMVVLWFAPAAMARLGPCGLLLAGALGTLVRWCGMALDPPLAVFILLQTLNACTMACVYLAWMGFIQKLVPDRASARAQNALMTLTGLSMAGMTFLMGPVYHALGGKAYFVAAILPALATGLVIANRRRLV